MKPERWQQIDKLLEQALEQEPGRRGVFLDEACQGDAALRQEVESLLSAHGKAGHFIEAGPLDAAVARTRAVAAQSLTGRHVGHYQILSRLGEGGMGVVYKARDQHLDRFVGIKVLPPELVADPDRKRRFAQEAKAASALNHPNIITIHDIASENGRDFIVMEYVQGKTLGQLIPRRGLKLNEVLKYAIQIADALAKAHTAGIVHRDLKPGNIMVGEGGLVKVLDFGLAKLTERPEVKENEATGTLQPRTDEGMIVGTASYMSPEQAAGKPVDARSDVFSFGSVLYEMVTGKRAFQGDSPMSTVSAVLREDPKPVGDLVAGLPRELERVINRCLRKEPSRRFQGMADLKVALEELKEEFDSGSLPEAQAAATRKPSRVSRLRWLALGGAGFVLAAASWLWLGRHDTGQPDSSFNPVPLTTYPGWEFSPSFSPDGSQVAFAWSKTDEAGEADIYIKQISVEEPFRLTDDPAPDVNPAWSPDGRTIAFGRYLSPERVAYLVKPQRGGPERTIGEFDLSAHLNVFNAVANCAWTQDSKSLVVVGRGAAEDQQALFLVSLATLQRHRLTDPPSSMADGDPKLSPNGRALVFSRRETSGDRLYRLNLSEDFKPQGEPGRLGFDDRPSFSAVWTPDGREILAVSGDRLWRMAAANSGLPRQLAFAGERVFGGIDLSRQGGRLAYSVWPSDTNIRRVHLREPGAESKEGEKFIESSQREMMPAYGPDGRRIAFQSFRSGTPEIWLCDSDGSHLRQLTSFGGPFTNSPRWSPDGRQIVFYSSASGNRDIYVVRADGGGVPRQLTTDPSIDTNPAWSADGKWIYFSSERSGQAMIWKVAEGGGEAAAVAGIQSGQAVESPDGKFLYYGKGWPNEYCLWRVSTSGGEESLVVDSLHPRGGQVVADEGIYFISKPDDKGVSHIRFKDSASSELRTIAPIRGRVGWGLTVSPDRRSFLYTRAEPTGSDLMLVENFR